jgi:hypothetical protein
MGVALRQGTLDCGTCYSGLLRQACDERGYSGVSVRNIASTWRLHHGTVSLARDRLISARLLHKSKKRRGQTRQTKVYKLPKIAWESGLQTDSNN